MKAGSFQAMQFRKQLATDMQYAPDYRTEAAQAEAYFDSLQLDPQVKQFMEDRGQPVLVNNLIQPTINGVLGMEAKTRTDMMVRADDSAGEVLAEALNEKLNEHVRLSRVHRANSDAFKREIIGGLGWVEVRRNTDPFGTDYIVEEVDWREVHYDWRSTRPDLQDARYVCREKYIDADVLLTHFPKHKDLIERVVNGAGLDEMVMAMTTTNVMPDLVGPYTTELQSQFDVYGGNYVNEERRQVRVMHAQYRVPRRGYVIKAGPVKMEYQPNNRIHRALVESGRAQAIPATYMAIRHAWFLGPHLLADAPSPYPHNQFNLVPFFGFREGGTRKPYGLVRNLISAQDEVNFRRSMVTWALKARLIIKDEDAVVGSDQELHEKVASVDGVVNLNPDRVNRTHGDKGFAIHTETGVAQQQFTIMQDAMKQIQDLAGVYSAFLGQDNGAQSGKAINSLVEQATVTMSDLFDNYQFGRQQVGELLLSMIQADIGENETEIQAYIHESRPTKHIVLNKREKDEEGNVVITNRVQQLRRHVVLADVQSSPGYRAQQLEQLMTLAGTLPDQAKMMILEDIIELTELPKKSELINKVKQAIGLGVNIEDMSEEERAEYEQAQQQKMEETKLIMRGRMAEIANKEADAEAKAAEVQRKKADTAYTQRRTDALNSTERLDEARAAELLSRIEQQEFENTMQQNAASTAVDQQIERLIDAI